MKSMVPTSGQSLHQHFPVAVHWEHRTQMANSLEFAQSFPSCSADHSLSIHPHAQPNCVVAYKAPRHLLLRYRNGEVHFEKWHSRLSFPVMPPPGIFSLSLLDTEGRQGGKDMQEEDWAAQH